MRDNEETVSPQQPGSQTENPAIWDGDNHDTNSQKPIVSLRRIEANRRNSTNSTGPKTAAGKKKVSRNAVQHGFYSKWLLIQHPDGSEGADEYQDLYATIFKHYQPVGWPEERWVETIAVWSWRLRRVIRHESGQINRSLSQHRYDAQQSRASDPEEPEFVLPGRPEMDAMVDHLFLTSEGLENQMRYEAMINRQLNHAIGELERLQVRRKGESIAL